MPEPDPIIPDRAPTKRELDILKVLWDHGASSVKDVHRHLQAAQTDELAYTTVQTLLRLMDGRGLVTHTVTGRQFIYEPAFSRQDSATQFLERVFDGAASELMLCLLDSERVSADELDKLQALIHAARQRTGGEAP
jgi:predicted transcriptional regulator